MYILHDCLKLYLTLYLCIFMDQYIFLHIFLFTAHAFEDKIGTDKLETFALVGCGNSWEAHRSWWMFPICVLFNNSQARPFATVSAISSWERIWKSFVQRYSFFGFFFFYIYVYINLCRSLNRKITASHREIKPGFVFFMYTICLYHYAWRFKNVCQQ